MGQLQKSHGNLFFFLMTTAVKLLYAERWNHLAKWLAKMMELAKLISLIREKIISIFITDWKFLLHLLHETEKNKFIIYHFDN